MIPSLLLICYICITLFVSPLKVDSFRATVGLHPQFKSVITGTYPGTPVTPSQTISLYIRKVIHSLRGYSLTLIPRALFSSAYDMYPMNKLKALIMAILTLIVVTGWFATFRKTRLINIYVFIFISVLFIYGPLYTRLVVPIIPFLFFYFYSGLEIILNSIIKKENVAIAIIIVLWIGVIFDNTFRSFTDPHRTMPAKFGDNAYQACIEWVVENVKPNDIVVSQIYSYLYIRRGPYCIPYYGAKTANEFMAYLDTYNAKYIVVSPFYQRPSSTYMNIIRKAVDIYPHSFNRVFGRNEEESYVLEYLSKKER